MVACDLKDDQEIVSPALIIVSSVQTTASPQDSGRRQDLNAQVVVGAKCLYGTSHFSLSYMHFPSESYPCSAVVGEEVLDLGRWKQGGVQRVKARTRQSRASACLCLCEIDC